MEGINDGGVNGICPVIFLHLLKNVKNEWNSVVEGYKPQDFSFFHRSEKLVQLVAATDRAWCEVWPNGIAHPDAPTIYPTVA